jgi:hypothetical protein
MIFFGTGKYPVVLSLTFRTRATVMKVSGSAIITKSKTLGKTDKGKSSGGLVTKHARRAVGREEVRFRSRDIALQAGDAVSLHEDDLRVAGGARERRENRGRHVRYLKKTRG